MKRFFLIQLLLLSAFAWASAQNADIRGFEERVRNVYDRVYPAAVKLIALDSLDNERGTGSGVVVSEEGLILTVGHMNKPGGRFRVVFPDGRRVTALGLGSVSFVDAAMMQIEEEGPFPFVPVGRSAGLRRGTPCIALGAAGSLKSEDQALRLGFVVAGEQEEEMTGQGQRRRTQRRLHTTCLMEPGDSGGPTFDLEGRVIGLRSSILQPLNDNFDVPIDYYLQYWDFLLSGQSARRPSEDDRKSLPERDTTDMWIPPMVFSDTTSVLLQYAAQLPLDCFTVTSTIGDSTVRISGTPLRMDEFLPLNADRNKTFVLSKSSMVAESPEVLLPTGETVGAQVVGRDAARDLVLLECGGTAGYRLADISSGVEHISHERIGTFLISVLPQENYRFSVAGAVPFEIKGISRAGYLGAGMEQRGDGIYFASIAEDSPAKAAGLTPGQKIVSIDGVSASTTRQVIDIIQSKMAGDMILLECAGEDIVVVKEIVLTNRPLVSGSHIAERFDGGKSIVRDGFGHVFVHDARILPQECGSAVVDAKGRLYGINIARLSRTSTLVMPVEEIKAFLEECMQIFPENLISEHN